jgi:hypothetical protein
VIGRRSRRCVEIAIENWGGWGDGSTIACRNVLEQTEVSACCIVDA